MSAERLQKVLARAGIASRRHAEELISAGRVRVDGRVESELGVRVNPRARIEVDGRVVVAEPFVYLVLHKPRGVVTTLKDPERRPTIADYLKDVGARVVPVGRLDFHTSGALICTNDGEFASRLMHPRYHAQKEYVAKVAGVVDEKSLERFRERIDIDGRETRPAEVNLLRVEDGKSWLSVKLGEGRNRQVRRLGEHAGMAVMRLVRVAQAGITTDGLKPGEWRMLTVDELKDLKREYGVPRRVHAPDARFADTRGGHVTLRQPKARPERGAEGRRREPERGDRRDARGTSSGERGFPSERRVGRTDERRGPSERRVGRTDERRGPKVRESTERRAPRAERRGPAARESTERRSAGAERRGEQARRQEERPSPGGPRRHARPDVRRETQREERPRTSARGERVFGRRRGT